MRRPKPGRQERGIALLLTIFGLLLLTAIAAAMMFSSDSETTISVNYRDKESANYAALSGLQEARDRLHPLNGDLSGFASLGRTLAVGPGPTQVPSLVNPGQVLYILNPDPTQLETAASLSPWLAVIGGKQNPYFDSELCQEKSMTALGVATNAPGSPCAVVPAGACTAAGGGGGNWCQYYDNSANATPWQLTDAGGNRIPLDYKWVRITLKADNSGIAYVQTPTSAANGTQVCWDTRYDQQVQKPATAGSDCLGATSYAIGSVSLVSGGTGYSSANPPTISFVGGGGSGAAATPVLTNTTGSITSATLFPPSFSGAGYTSAPTVTITNPGTGTGATFQAFVGGSPVTALSLGSTNYCYQSGTTGLSVAFSPNPPPTLGGSASASVTMTGVACIASATATASCGNGKKKAVLPLSYSGGFAGSVTLDNQGKISGGPVTITNVGSYNSSPGTQDIKVNGCDVFVTFNTGIQINSVSLAQGGEYVTAPTATISGPPPTAPNSTQPTVNVTWVPGATNGQLTGLQVTNGGNGYTNNTANNYTLAFTGGGGVGATGAATSSGSATYVSGITLTNGGAGYLSAPQVVISGPGAGASATATLLGGQQIELGQVYMLTSLAVTKSGTRSMAQMEAAVTPPFKFELGGALTIAGPTPTFSTPNSNNLVMNGNDAAGSGGTEPASCNHSSGIPLPAIGVYDSSAQSCIVGGGATCGSGLGKPQNYIGAQGSPDVYVTPAANPDPSDLTGIISQIWSTAGTQQIGPNYDPNNPCSQATCNSYTNGDISNYGSVSNIQGIVVNGNLTLSGNVTGYGVLVVTGNLTLQGNFAWNGVVLVMGTATVQHNGGGNGQITGAMYVANALGNTLGSASFSWSGGGGNTIQYDHCWADDLLARYPPKTSSQPLQVLSTRSLQF